MRERIFIGVAWPYADGPLHLGHIAGAYLPPDIFARYHRQEGFAACQYAIDQFKQKLPTQKKEAYEDGSIWVEGK
ncbi:unnamed protein product [marine sediment metagenome]|uniref:Methionyl/Leucyl tRNA synthetase domain-containing protein n=1 Tax=marine sediment metagenome TaxID=412755 RepID=X1UF86_9ZZZZ